MSRSKPPAEPAQLETWEVTWWQVDKGALVLHSRSFDAPGDARVAYTTLHSTTDPKIVRHHWNIAKARWETTDVIGQAVSVERAHEINVRGFAALRRIIEHARGSDTRGVFGSLDQALAADKLEAEPEEPLVGETSADCIVCDYLCQFGLSVAECHATIADQPQLEYADITTHQERF